MGWGFLLPAEDESRRPASTPFARFLFVRESGAERRLSGTIVQGRRGGAGAIRREYQVRERSRTIYPPAHHLDVRDISSGPAPIVIPWLHSPLMPRPASGARRASRSAGGPGRSSSWGRYSSSSAS